MKSYLFIASILTVSFSTAQVDSTTSNTSSNVNQTNREIPVYNFDSLAPLLQTSSDKIHIVNFWAMWCAPCVRELPIFQEYEKNNPTVELILVSLDFPENIDAQLKPLLEKRGITSKVILLDDPDSNSWIDKVDSNWTGAIPFTIIFNNNNRTFHERPFEDIKDLENEINNTIKNK